jgi:hypothetical protein
VRFLLDENLEAIAARVVSVYAGRHGDFFVHLGDLDGLGAPDEDIPTLATENDCDCLVTVNVKDFGAKKFYYEALMAQGLHVCVLRPGKIAFRGDQQTSLLLKNYAQLRRHIEGAGGPRLMIANWTEVRVRTIEQLIAEFDEGNRLP